MILGHTAKKIFALSIIGNESALGSNIVFKYDAATTVHGERPESSECD
jgi:hypothetical protein